MKWKGWQLFFVFAIMNLIIIFKISVIIGGSLHPPLPKSPPYPWRATAQSSSPVYELLRRQLWGTSSPTFYPSEKHCPCAQNYVSHTRWPHQRSSDCFTDLLVVHSPHTRALWWSCRATPNWCFKVIQHRMKMAAVGRAPTAFNLLMPHLLSSWGMTFSSIPLSFFLPIIGLV